MVMATTNIWREWATSGGWGTLGKTIGQLG